LERALALAEPEGFMRTFVDEGEPMRQVLADCRGQMERQARTTEGENAQRWLAYIDKLLAAFGQSLKSTEASVVRYRPSAIGELVEPLTDREQEVLRLVAEGLSDRQIAEKMTVVVGTVKRHLNNLYGKLGVHSRTQAMARAKELGLL
jgi:LuxR family maltose regulon positive regulatory protein